MVFQLGVYRFLHWIRLQINLRIHYFRIYLITRIWGQRPIESIWMILLIKEMLIWRKKHHGKVRSLVKWDLTLKKINWKIKICLYPTVIKPGFCFGGTSFTHINVSFNFVGRISFVKYICDTFEDCRNALDEKRNINWS